MSNGNSRICAICCADLREARSLPCGHSFCTKCIQQLIDGTGGANCPVDNLRFDVPAGLAGNLPRNLKFYQVLDAALSNRKLAPQQTGTETLTGTDVCSDHDGKTATFFCATCRVASCVECAKRHAEHDFFFWQELADKSRLQLQELQCRALRLDQHLQTRHVAASAHIQTEFEKCQAALHFTVSQFELVAQLLRAACSKLKDVPMQATKQVESSLKVGDAERLHTRVNATLEAIGAIGNNRQLTCLLTDLQTLTHTVRDMEQEFDQLQLQPNTGMPLRFAVDDKLALDLLNLRKLALILKTNFDTQTYCFINRQTPNTAVVPLPKAKTLITLPLLPLNPYRLKSFEEEPRDCPLSLATGAKSIGSNYLEMLLSANHKNVLKSGESDVIICAGGFHGLQPSKRTIVFEPQKNRWCRVSDMSTARRFTAATSFDNRVIVAGGWYGMESVEQYDAETNSWTPFRSLMVGRHGHALVNLNGCLLAFGGSSGKDYLRSAERYVAGNETWQPASPLNSPRAYFAASVFARGVIAAGGFLHTELSSCEVYDVQKKHWVPIAALKKRRCGATAAACSKKVFVFGGHENGETYLDDVEQYDSETDAWTLLDVRSKVPRVGSTAVSLGNRIFILGGSCTFFSSDTASAECFNCDLRRLSDVASLPNTSRYHVSSSVRISIDASRRIFKEDV